MSQVRLLEGGGARGHVPPSEECMGRAPGKQNYQLLGQEARYTVKYQAIRWLRTITLLGEEMIKEGAREQRGKQMKFVHSYREKSTCSAATDVETVERTP